MIFFTAYFCLFTYISAALCCVSYLQRIKHRLSAVITHQCYIPLIDLMTPFINSAQCSEQAMLTAVSGLLIRFFS